MLRRAVIASLLTAWAAACRADDATTPIDLDLSETVEITGRLDAGKPNAAAAPATRADEKDLRSARSLPEALAGLPEIVSVDQVGNGRQLSLSLRGFSGEEGATALVVDGVRMNDADTGLAPWELVPLHDVEDVTIASGPKGAFVGGGSLAGVVEVTRRRPSATRQADLRLRGGSLGFRDASATLTGPVGRWRLLGSAGGFRDEGFRDDAGSRESSARVAAERDFGPATLRLSLSHFDGRWRQPGALTKAELRADPSDATYNALDAQSSRQDLATARLDREGERNSVSAVASWRDESADILATGRSCYGFRTKDDQAGLSGSVEGETTLRDRDGLRLAVRWGAEASRDRLHPEGFATDDTCDGEIHEETPSSAVAVAWDRGAIFGGLGATLRSGLALELAVRHDASRVERTGAEVGASGRWEDVTGRRRFGDTTLRLGVGREHALKTVRVSWTTAWEQSFLPPSAIQLFAYPGFFSNPGLVAQRGSGPSASLRVAWTRVELDVDAFETRVTDEIAYDDAQLRNVNAGATRRRGGSIGLAWQPRDGVRLEAGQSFVDARFRAGFDATTHVEKGARVPLVPSARTRLALVLGPWRGLSARVELQRVGRAALSNDFDGTEPLLGARRLLALEVEKEIAHGVSLELAADNVLDDDHPSRGIESWGIDYFTPSAPRRVTFGVAWRLR